MSTGTSLLTRWTWILLVLAGGAAAAAETPTGVGSLVVHGWPRGRQVWIDGKYAGRIPLLVDSLPAGKLWVEVGGIPGERRWSPPTRIRAIVRAGWTDTLAVGRPRDAGEALDRVAVPVRPEEELLAEDARRTPPSAVLLPAAAVALGVAGFWCRHAADESYKDYQTTLDRGAMDRLFRRAERLDRAAVACWIGSEACLLAAAWIWLRAGPDLPVRVSAESGTVRVGIALPPSSGREATAGARTGGGR